MGMIRRYLKVATITLQPQKEMAHDEKVIKDELNRKMIRSKLVRP